MTVVQQSCIVAGKYGPMVAQYAVDVYYFHVVLFLCMPCLSVHCREHKDAADKTDPKSDRPTRTDKHCEKEIFVHQLLVATSKTLSKMLVFQLQ